MSEFDGTMIAFDNDNLIKVSESAEEVDQEIKDVLSDVVQGWRLLHLTDVKGDDVRVNVDRISYYRGARKGSGRMRTI